MLCRYIARPAVSEERLKLLPSGDVVLKLKTKYSDGTSHLLFSGLEFVEKLAALVPPPRIYLTRFFGCLAPHAKIRSQVVPKKEEPEAANAAAAHGTGADDADEKQKRKKRMSWAELLARVFAIDMKNCPKCSGDLKIVSAVLEGQAIRKILGHLGIPDIPPLISPPAFGAQMSFE